MSPRKVFLELVCVSFFFQSIIAVSSAFGDVKFKASQIELKAETERTFHTKFRDLLSDEGSGDLTWSLLTSAPSWLYVNIGKEFMSGTPSISNAGTSSFSLSVSDNQTDKGGIAKIIIHVRIVPVWNESPIQLGKHPENVLFTFDLNDKITFAGNGSLTFTIEDPDGDAPWLYYKGNGIISGTPLKEHIGQYEITVTAITPQGISVPVKAMGEVVEVSCPKWALNPITLKNAREDSKYSVDVSKYVDNPDNADLAFSLPTGAPTGWIEMSEGGTLSGTPGIKDVGPASLVAKVSANIHAVLCEDETTLKFKVIHTNHPPTWEEDPIRVSVDEGQPLSKDLAQYAKDIDPMDTLVFFKISGPSWIQVSKEGLLTGEPQNEHIGQYFFKVRADDQNGGVADVTVIVTVNSINKPPYWTKDPISLPEGTAGITYAESVASYAKDPEGEKLTFEKVSGPDWGFVTNTGLIFGTPEDGDQGVNTFRVRAIDPHKAFADVTVNLVINVDSNHDPIWTKDPIPLGDIPVEENFNFDLSQYAYDEDGDKLNFAKVSGPDWMYVSSQGAIMGVPQKKDLGEFTAEFSVTDGKAKAYVSAFGRVVDESNRPPVCKDEAWTFNIYEEKIYQFKLSDPKYVVDPDGDKLTFDLLKTEKWFGLTDSGLLIFAPKHEHLGDHKYEVKVSDDKGAYDQCTMLVRVLEDCEPPLWLEDPIRFEAFANKWFIRTVADKAKDPKGTDLTFQKKSGPDWLTLLPDGRIYGTPQMDDVGDNIFMVTATNSCQTADAAIVIKVKSDDETVDEIQVDAPVPGARAENMWVVDNSCSWSEGNYLMDQLDSYIDVYFNTLESANIHHKGIYLSSDFRSFQRPIRNSYGSYFLTWQDNYLGNSFRYRMDRSQVSEGNNSPLWALNCFYCRVEYEFPEIYRDFFSEEVPMDVMIVSKNPDTYRNYAFMTPKSGWTPSDFANYFKNFHKKEKQPYRISAIARDCPAQQNTNYSPNEDNPYEVLTSRTGGDCYPERSLDMERYLKEYANAVIFRAYVGAKDRIPLSKKPIDPKKIEVTIGGEIILGNTGSYSDKWYYDTYTNEIVIRWHLMDWSRINPGDMIRIKYKAASSSIMG